MSRWTQEEVEYLIAEHTPEGKSDGEIAEDLGRTEMAVYRKRQKLNLGINTNEAGTEWSTKELEFLKSNYPSMSYKELARATNRTVAAIRVKASRMGLKKAKDLD